MNPLHHRRDQPIIFDLHGEPIRLYEFLALNYMVWRVQQSFGHLTPIILWNVSSAVRSLFREAYRNYIRAEYRDLSIGVVATDCEIDKYRFKYPAGVAIWLFDAPGITIPNTMMCKIQDVGEWWVVNFQLAEPTLEVPVPGRFENQVEK